MRYIGEELFTEMEYIRSHFQSDKFQYESNLKSALIGVLVSEMCSEFCKLDPGS